MEVPPGASTRKDEVRLLKERLWREQATHLREQLVASSAEQNPVKIDALNRAAAAFLSERYKKTPSVELKENMEPTLLREALTRELLDWLPEQPPAHLRITKGTLLGSPSLYPPPPNEIAVAAFRHGLIDGVPHQVEEVTERFGLTKQRVHQISDRISGRLQRSVGIREALVPRQ